MCDICESAKIPRKAFYRYFENKEGILQALILHVLQGYEEKDDASEYDDEGQFYSPVLSDAG